MSAEQDAAAKKKAKKARQAAARVGGAAAAAAAPEATPSPVASTSAAAVPTTTTATKSTRAPPPAFTYGDEPMAAVWEYFPDRSKLRKGELLDYEQEWNLKRKTSPEMQAREELNEGIYEQLREAAEAHRRVRMWARKWIAPGMRMIDIAQRIEKALRTAVGADGLERGIAFPVGLSLNHCAAHYCPNVGDTVVLGKDDVLKVDLGLHVGGRIIDSAFTMAWNPQFDPLLEAVREATNAAVKFVGVDVRLNDIGAVVQEVMESHEVTIDGKTHIVKPIRNLYGHTLGLYQVHSGKSIPIAKGAGDSTKLEEGDLLAIETFGSTGKGHVQDDGDCSHYMRAFSPAAASASAIRTGGAKARELLAHINKSYGTLAWAKRWVDEAGISRYQLALKGLVDAGIVDPYPPLCDVQGSYVAQFEHTVALKPTGKEVLSRGDDY